MFAAFQTEDGNEMWCSTAIYFLLFAVWLCSSLANGLNAPQSTQSAFDTPLGILALCLLFDPRVFGWILLLHNTFLLHRAPCPGRCTNTFFQCKFYFAFSFFCASFFNGFFSFVIPFKWRWLLPFHQIVCSGNEKAKQFKAKQSRERILLLLF